MADNASSKAFDWAAKNTINMARVEAGSVRRVKAFLGGLESDLVKILADNPNLSAAKKAKLEAIIDSAGQAIGSTYSKIKADSAADLAGVAKAQSKGAAAMVNAGIGADVVGAILTESQLAAVASKTAVFGHASGAWWKAQDEGLRMKFAAQMRQGYALGEDVDQLTRRIRGTKANDYKDGIMAVSRREAEALVRSSIQTISNEAHLKSFEALSDTIKGIEWVATLDTRTTKICRALDGLVWTFPDLKPVNHGKAFPGPVAHWNCRSTQIPVLRSWAELSGKPIKALDGDTYAAKLAAKLKEKGMAPEQIAVAEANARASMDGQASGSPDMEKWMKGKPDSEIKAMIGPTRAKMLAEGKITIHDLTDQSNRPLTIAQLEAGIDAGTIPDETEGSDFAPFDPTLLKAPTGKVAKAIQDAAATKISNVISNPAGQQLLAQSLAKVQADQPSLSPTEMLAKAEEMAATKQAAATKSATLSKAKKKLLDGEPATASQQKVIDELTAEEKGAFLEAVADAKKLKDADAITTKADDLKAKADAILAKNPLADAYGDSEIFAAVWDMASKGDAASMKAAAGVEEYITAKQANNQATAKLKAWEANPTKKAALDKATAGGVDLTPSQLLTAAEYILGGEVAAATAGNNLAVAKKSMKALTGMDNPTPASVNAWLKQQGKDPAEFLAEFNATMKEKQDAATKSATLSKAKKKLAAGEAATPAQKAALDSLTPDELAAFNDDVAALKGVAPATKAAEEAAAKAAEAVAAKTAAEATVKASQAKAAQQSAAATVPHPDELKILRTLGGSTGAQLAEDAAGNRYVVKRGADADHVRTEFLADEMYRALGANVPEGGLFETKSGPVKVTKFLDGGVPLQNLTGKARDDAFAKLREGFQADALLANWDVAGTGFDNVMVTPDGRVWRIDNGGSLQYRAQGSLSGKDFDRYPDELWSMRQAGNISAPIYSALDTLQIARQIEAADLDAVLRVPMPDATKAILEGRIAEMRHLARRAVDFDHDGYTGPHVDRVARATLDLRKSGVSGSMPATLTPTPGAAYQVTDETGRAFGNLRTAKNSNGQTVVAKVPGDVYSDDILAASKSMAYAANQGNDITAGNALKKTQVALAHKPKMEAILASGTANPDQTAMATKYLAQLNELEKLANAGGIPAGPPPMFAAYSPPVVGKPTQAPNGSVVKQWTDLMKAEGIDPSPIYDWMDSQSGNSWSQKTQAMKVGFAKQFADPEKEFYWDGNGIKASWKSAQTHYKAAVAKAGGPEKFERLISSWHALTQEVLSEIDAPWIDREKRAVLLYRTFKQDEIDGSFSRPDAAGIFTARRGTTESHSIYKTTSIMGSIVTVQAVPFSRIMATYWTEKPGLPGSGGFLGDYEAEFAANTSGLRVLKSQNFKPPGFDDESKDADKWGVPTDHLRP